MTRIKNSIKFGCVSTYVTCTIDFQYWQWISKCCLLWNIWLNQEIYSFTYDICFIV